MVWLSKDGGRAHGQSYTAAGLPRGAEFVIHLVGRDGLPVGASSCGIGNRHIHSTSQ